MSNLAEIALSFILTTPCLLIVIVSEIQDKLLDIERLKDSIIL